MEGVGVTEGGEGEKRSKELNGAGERAGVNRRRRVKAGIGEIKEGIGVGVRVVKEKGKELSGDVKEKGKELSGVRESKGENVTQVELLRGENGASGGIGVKVGDGAGVELIELDKLDNGAKISGDNSMGYLSARPKKSPVVSTPSKSTKSMKDAKNQPKIDIFMEKIRREKDNKGDT